MSAIAIITARGGSKRIPRKNIKKFCGKPIISYSVKAAIKSGLFDEVMISTDNEEIADIARKYGAEVPFLRSKKNSDDFATTMDVIREVVERYKDLGETFEYVACIYPTAPFVNARKLRDSYSFFLEKNVDALTSVVPFSFPPQRAFVIEKDLLKYKWPENYPKRSQDLERFYHDAGQFYYYKTDCLHKEVAEMVQVPYVLPETEVQDIDNESDWVIAEMKYRMMVEK